MIVEVIKIIVAMIVGAWLGLAIAWVFFWLPMQFIMWLWDEWKFR